MIKVTADGRVFDEMHVDGGTATQVFLMPGGNSLRDVDKALGQTRSRSVYIIRNGSFAPQYKKMERGCSASRRSPLRRKPGRHTGSEALRTGE
jgi:hypothetical protein